MRAGEAPPGEARRDERVWVGRLKVGTVDLAQAWEQKPFG